MATLKEYFERDQRSALGFNKQWPLIDQETGIPLIEISTRLNIAFESNAVYVSFYIPATDKVQCPSRIALNNLQAVLDMRNEVYVAGGMPGEDPSTTKEAVFTGRIYIYDENDISDEDRNYIFSQAQKLGHSIKIRGRNYSEERSAHEHPLAFISHDSRDKEEIARPLALALQKQLCPVWYDEFSLNLGDSLRGSIEKGLRECRKCIFIVTPNFLANGGWSKREYDSIFTRELIERQNVIIPIWHGVTAEDVYAYSPILADKYAAIWTDADEVARRLISIVQA